MWKIYLNVYHFRSHSNGTQIVFLFQLKFSQMKRVSAIFIIFLGCCMAGPAYAQKPKGNYKANKEAIRQAYKDQMREITAQRSLPAHRKKQQRDAAIDKYLADKRSNRLAFRKSTDPNRDATEKRNRGYVPRLHKE